MDRIEWIVVTAIVILLIMTGVGIYYNEEAQARYEVQHHCVVRGHTNPTNGIGFGSKGSPVVTFNPGQTIYSCDDDEIIIR